MSRKKELLNIINNTKDPMLRRLYTAAYITKGLKDSDINIVMVGGSAVEFYSAANYMTHDIDFVITSTDGVKEVMTNLGFINDNAVWSIPGTDMIVEFPKGPLDGSWDKVKTVETLYGQVTVIGIEDIILDRASGVQFWNDSDEWVKFLMISHQDNIDFDYMNKRAKELMCVETIENIQKWVYEQKFLQSISQAPEIKNVSKHSNSKTLYVAYAKEILKDVAGHWNNDLDYKIAKKMLIDGFEEYQVNCALKYSVNKDIKPREITKNLLKDKDVIKAINDKDRGR